MVTFITGNQHKFKEVQAVLGDSVTGQDIDLPEIQSLDVKEVIKVKLLDARKVVSSGAIMVDDTGYYFESLGRLPGVFSKFFLEELGHAGIYDLVSKLSTSRATSYTCIGYMDEDNHIEYFTAEVHGNIVAPVTGNGFGFDSLFIPDGSTKRFSEMEESTFKDVKPRGKAIASLKEYIESKK
jgi:XTP/dITP diphosphohydrolase